MSKETLISIALRTRFSVSTVSRVLSGQAAKYRISEKTVALISREAERCNYTPSLLAKGLRTNRTDTIGLLIPNIENSFFAGVAGVVIRESRNYNYKVVVVDTQEDERNEQDGLSALLCLALMRFAQWGGSCLGQIVTDVLPTSESVAIAILLSLMAALLVIMGSPLSLKSPAVVEEDAVDALALRVKRVAVQCGLSPREQEVLAIWATGHTGAYIEKQLFISRNTVKTHLNHIYAKTKTANREELLELLESVDAG